MKNIWKLMMVALMAIAMVGCQQIDDDGGKKDEPKKATIPGVYSFTIKDGMVNTSGNYWGSSDNIDTIKFVLVKKGIAFEGEATFTDANQCYVYSNNDIDNGCIYFEQAGNDWLQVSGKYDNSKYNAVAVKKNGRGYKVIFDLSKIAEADLVSKGADETNGDKWGNFNDLTSDYVPYIIGSVTGNCYDAEGNPDGYEFDVTMWNAGVVKMNASTEAFPANVKKPTTSAAPTTLPIDWTKVLGVAGIFNSWTFSPLTDDTYTFVYDLTDDMECEFGLISDSDWGYKVVNFTLNQLGSEVTIEGIKCVGAGSNAKIAEGILKKGQKYSIVITTKNENDGKVKLVEAND